MRNYYKRQAGQAATEFLIAAVFLLVPLFLIIPLLGKYIDIKHAAICQARYSAWEYTVWNIYDIKLLFGDLHAADYGDPTSKDVPLNPLWRDHRGMPLFTLNADPAHLQNTKTPMPLGTVGELAGGFFEFVEFVLNTFADLTGNDHFFDSHGYYTSDVTLRVRPLDQILPRTALSPDNDADRKDHDDDNYLTIRAKAAVLTDDWNAGSPRHADSRSRGLVLTSLLSPLSTIVDGIIQPINKGLSYVPGFSIKLPGVPKFGYVVDDLIPYEHRYDDTMKLQEKQGLSSYEER